MGIRQEVEEKIRSSWIDVKVAEWVILNLPILELEGKHPSCPVYSLNLEQGLNISGDSSSVIKDFSNTYKIVMSGGFEGTRGHYTAVNDMQEYRAITTGLTTPIVLMLEPDSYIRNRKNRNPVLNLDERTDMWKTTGMVDAIIRLPEKPTSLDDKKYYLFVHKYIQPATWCVNIENKSWTEILQRGQINKRYDVGKLFVHRPYLHTSFLASTQKMVVERVIKELRTYCSVLASDYKTYEQDSVAFHNRVEKLFIEFSNGL